MSVNIFLVNAFEILILELYFKCNLMKENRLLFFHKNPITGIICKVNELSFIVGKFRSMLLCCCMVRFAADKGYKNSQYLIFLLDLAHMILL